MTSLRLVLLRPRNAANVGSIARAMANFGLTDWAWVDPNPSLATDAGALRLAVQAESLMLNVRICSSFSEAIQDTDWIVGTTMRSVEGLRKIGPRETMKQAWANPSRVAMIFGDERSGLRNEELRKCHAVTGIPTVAGQPSLNLAQAAMLYCYEFRMAQLEHQQGGEAPVATLASVQDQQGLEKTLVSTLTKGGFLSPHRSSKALETLLGPWKRSRLRFKETKMWNSALRSLAKRLE